MAKKDALKKKNPTMRVPPSKRNSDSEFESYQPSSDSEATESNLAADPEPKHDSEPEPEAKHDAHDEPPPQGEKRRKSKNDRPVVGSNEPVNITQQSVVGPRTSPPDNTKLVELLGKSKRRTSQRIASMSKKQKISLINEGAEATIPFPSDTRMFDSFHTVSLGRDDSDNIIVEGPVVVPSQPSRKEKNLQPEHDHHETENDGGMEVGGTAVEVPHVTEDNVEEDEQPEPLVPINPEDQSRMATQDLSEHTELEPELINVQMPLDHEDQHKIAIEGAGEQTEVDPKPLNMEIPFEPELTLKPWLQPEAEVTAANDTPLSADEMITNVLLSMNKGEQDHDSKQNPQPQSEARIKSPRRPRSMQDPRYCPCLN
ncbi:hypothetical protein PIB30_012893 [Stylosanthes scabra]|uniref:Uncharacterized protein n=1 Tax=Stylosanthes scabra TaxID=79078 RepID=A0ABU6X7V5_9FABA|nr:hypothetical protein [Stylosanthes scabra]